MRLRSLARRAMRRPALVASLSPKGGTGETTLAVLVAQLVSVRLRWPVLVLDTDFTGGTAREHVPSDGQSSATLVDALEAIRAGKVRGPADLLRYVCVIPGGAPDHGFSSDLITEIPHPGWCELTRLGAAVGEGP